MSNWKNMTADEIVKEQLYGGVLMVTDVITALDMFRSAQPHTIAEMTDYVALEEVQMIMDCHGITLPKEAVTEFAWVHQRLFTMIMRAEIDGLIEDGLVEGRGTKTCEQYKRKVPAFALTAKGQEVISRLFPTAVINQAVDWEKEQV